jgi:hypothetical protein
MTGKATSKRVRTAKKIPSSYELLCPECEETIPADNGSLFWDANEIRSGETRTCPRCGITLKLPKT